MLGLPWWLGGREPACSARVTGDAGSSLEGPLEEEMAAPSRVLAWRVPWTEEPGGLQSRGHKESDTTE